MPPVLLAWSDDTRWGSAGAATFMGSHRPGRANELARSHVIAKLERSSGRSVQLDRLNVCLNGGIELTGLKIGRTAVSR